jgi:hypothetical protein
MEKICGILEFRFLERGRCLLLADFLLDLIFDPEDEDHIFLPKWRYFSELHGVKTQ